MISGLKRIRGHPLATDGWKTPDPWRDLTTSFSFANLCFLSVWQNILFLSRRNAFFFVATSLGVDYLAAMFDVAILTAACWACIRLARRSLGRTAFRVVRMASIALFLLPLNALRMILSIHHQDLNLPFRLHIDSHLALLVLAPAAAIFFWMLWKYQRLAVSATAALLVGLCPYGIYLFGRAALSAALAATAAPRVYSLAPRVANAKVQRRVVWVIFDNWDYRLNFVDRPKYLSLPAVDRFRGESISATNARSPGRDTIDSLPSLLTGRPLVSARGREEPVYSFKDEKGRSGVRWNEVPGVFTAARQAGLNTALVGWYFPYCRLLNASLTDCASWPMPVPELAFGETFWEKAPGQLRTLVETDSFSPFSTSPLLRQKLRMFEAFMDRTGSMLKDPEIGLIFLHVPIPHYPHIYDRIDGRLTDRLDLPGPSVPNYFSDLALVDRTLAVWRKQLEDAGLWDKTTVILSTDHPLRLPQEGDGKSDLRIPFLLRLAGQPSGAAFDQRFYTVETASLVLAVLRGEISTLRDAQAWMANRAASDSGRSSELTFQIPPPAAR